MVKATVKATAKTTIKGTLNKFKIKNVEKIFDFFKK